MPQYNYQISIVDGGSTVNVETLGIPAPASTFAPYSQNIDTASGKRIGAGWARATWAWGFLTRTQFDTLRTLCPGGSVACWIRTLKEDMYTYAYYSGYMRWPDVPVDRRAGRALGLTLEFVGLEEYTP